MIERTPFPQATRSTPRYLPALLLFFLPAISVELLSGNTPILQYLNPATFVILNVSYGGAALLIREMVAWWNKGLQSILLLGLCYGMVCEGLMTKGFFDPYFYSAADFGLEDVGMFVGINTAWAFSISSFHAIFSITVPILLINALFPGKARWVGNKVFFTVLALFVAVIAFTYRYINVAHTPAPSSLITVLAMIIGCGVAARMFPGLRVRSFARQPGRLLLFGFGASFAFVFIFTDWGGVYHRIPSLAAHFAVLTGLLLLYFWILLKIPQITGRSQVALVIGMLVPMIYAASTQGFRLAIPEALIVAILAISWIVSRDDPINSFAEGKFPAEDS
jgi:hypothetical protein